MKASVKQRCLSRFGVKLGRLMKADVEAKAAALEELRAKQLSLRMMASAAEEQGDPSAARGLQREVQRLDKLKQQLKQEAAEGYGVKLSRHARSIPKRGPAEAPQYS